MEMMAKKKFPRVKEVLYAAERGGIENVKKYFEQKGMIIDPSTWCGQIKKSIDENHVNSVLVEIELIQEKFNYYVSKKGSDTGANSINK